MKCNFPNCNRTAESNGYCVGHASYASFKSVKVPKKQDKKSDTRKEEETVIKRIMACRNSSRPIERFFMGINIGDTPKKSQFSKLALEWVEEFENLIAVTEKVTV